MPLRFVERGGQRILQQLWVQHRTPRLMGERTETGQTRWQDVLLHVEDEPLRPDDWFVLEDEQTT